MHFEENFLVVYLVCSPGESHRYAGINLFVEIRYSNLENIGQDPNGATYEYFTCASF